MSTLLLCNVIIFLSQSYGDDIWEINSQIMFRKRNLIQGLKIYKTNRFDLMLKFKWYLNSYVKIKN